MTPILRLLPILAIFLTGCSHFDYTAVHIDIGDIKIADASVGGSEAVFTLKITNETVFPVVIDEERHKIYLNGTLIGEGTNKDTYALPNLVVTERKVTVQLRDAAAAEQVRDAIQHGGDYKIETLLITNSGGDRDKMTTTSTGRLGLAGN